MKDLVIFVKNNEKIIRISEGDDCNLDQEDINEGYVDYLYYDIFDPQDIEIGSVDGGMVLLKKPIKDEFNSIAEVLERVFDMSGYLHVAYYTLSGEDDWVALVGKEED